MTASKDQNPPSGSSGPRASARPVVVVPTSAAGDRTIVRAAPNERAIRSITAGAVVQVERPAVRRER